MDERNQWRSFTHSPTERIVCPSHMPTIQAFPEVVTEANQAQGNNSAISAVGLKTVDFHVDASGEATFHIPIEVPPGIADFVPKLTLVYGHRQPNGLMGVGWAFSGLSAIARTKATYAVDGFNGSINYDNKDRLSLDGQRLINVQGEYGQPNAVYYTELQSWNYLQEVNGGFVATAKDGRVMEYGTTANSRIFAVGRKDVRIWALSAVIDRNGNRIEYSYTQGLSGEDLGSYYPDEIRYTVRQDRKADRFVKFHYETRPDKVVSYVGGAPVITSSRLTGITTSIKSISSIQNILSYTFQYEISKATQLSRIITITESGVSSKDHAGFVCANILWSDTNTIGFNTNSTPSALNQPGNPELLPLDVTGDGRTDFVQFWTKDEVLHVSTYLATERAGDVTFAYASDSVLDAFPPNHQIFPADVDGDGRIDLIIAYQDSIDHSLNLAVYLSNGRKFIPAPGSPFKSGDPWDAASHINFFPMDVNGDGRTDLVEAYAQENMLYFRSYLSQFGQSSGVGFLPGIISPTQDPAQPANVIAFWAMDVNGDGMMDLVRVWKDVNSNIHITSYLSMSTAIDRVAFSSRIDTNLSGFDIEKNTFLPIDVNGDGIQDLLHIWKGPDGTTLHLTTFLCDAAGGFVEGPDTSFPEETIDWNHLYPIGLNGSGQVSLVSPWSDINGLLNFTIFQGSPSGQFRIIPSQPPVAVSQNPTFYGGDPDGNGKADLIQVYSDTNNIPHLIPYLSLGAYNDLISSVTNSIGGVISVVYAPLSDAAAYTHEESYSFPSASGRRYPQSLTPAQFPAQTVLGQAIYVVQSFTESEDTNIGRFPYNFVSSIMYFNAQIDLLGRGWQGFKRKKIIDLNSGKVTQQIYNQTFPYTGTVAENSIEADGKYASDPRVPQNIPALMQRTQNSYTVYQRGRSQNSQEIVEVLLTTQRVTDFLYGEENYNFQLAQTFAYDNYGNISKHVNLGYVDRTSLKPLDPEEVIYRYHLYQNDVFANGGWALGFLRYSKVSANQNDLDITQFLPGDLRLKRNVYEASTYNVASEAQWDDSNDIYLVTAYSYDSFGNRQSVTEPGGFITTYEYEPAYNTYKLKAISPKNDQGASLITSYGYDPRFGIEVARCDPNGSVFVQVLDEFGRVTAVQGPVNNASETSEKNLLSPFVTGSDELKTLFFGAKVITTETSAYLKDRNGGHYKEVMLLQKFTDSTEREFVWNRTYIDGLMLERQTIRQSGQADGNVVVVTSYNSGRKPIQESLPFFSLNTNGSEASHYTSTTYDVLGRATERREPTGADGNHTSATTWTYGRNGQVTITQAAGSTIEYTQIQEHHFYDAKDRVRQTLVPADNNAITLFQFDRLARLIRIIDPPTESNPQGVMNSTVYDSLDRKLTVDNPDQNTTGNSEIKAMKYEYDEVTGRLSKQTDAFTKTMVYSYDSLGRVINRTSSDGTAYHAVYDQGPVEAMGHMTEAAIKDAGGSIQSQYLYAYDKYGRTSQTSLLIAGEHAPFVTNSYFDPQGRIIQKTLPDKSKLLREYTYGQLTGLVLGNIQVSFPLETYHPTGRPERLIYGEGNIEGGCVAIDYTYSPSGQIYRETCANSGGNIINHSYHYDLLNQLLHIDAEEAADQTQKFTYVNRRLTAAVTPGFRPGEYAYDVSGNLTAKDEVVYKFRSHFAYSGMKNGTEVYSATQDSCGRTTVRTVNGETQHFEYDSFGYLQRITLTDGHAVCRMLNDSKGRRLSQTDSNGNTTFYVSAEYEVVKSADGSSSITKYLSDEHGVLASTTTGTIAKIQYLRRDHKGNITHVFNTDGSLLSVLGYSGYGEFVLLNGNTEPETKYEGRRWNATTQLYYFGARYYDPISGRFLTPDTQVGGSSLLQTGVFNRYAFELNNPVGFVDPTGHMPNWAWGLLIGASLVAAGVLIIATGGLAAPALVGVIAAAASGAAIAGGVSATFYSLGHRNNFSWKDFGIQTGISAGVGALGGAAFAGLNAGAVAATTALASWGGGGAWVVGGGVSILGGSLIGAAGGVGGQFFTNLAEGNRLTNGLAESAIFGGVFGGLAGGVGYVPGVKAAADAEAYASFNSSYMKELQDPSVSFDEGSGTGSDNEGFQDAERGALPQPIAKDPRPFYVRSYQRYSKWRVGATALRQGLNASADFPKGLMPSQCWDWSN